ncbi:MAG TPA: CdaR family protein [Chloroflexota bacterium]|nr:CdaR family protein [Chloroflexota bacterium]
MAVAPPAATPTGRLRFRLDPGRAIIALGLACALWIVVQNEANPERTDIPALTVPVDMVNVPPGLLVVSEQPQIQVRVRMPSESWSLLRPGSFRATADAGNASPGVNELPVRVEALEPRVRQVDPIPPLANVALEEVSERIMPVRLNILGNVPFGYAYSTPRIAPENVTVSGPSTAVQRVDSIVVDIRLDGLTVSLNATYAPRPLDARGTEVRAVRVNPSTVNVEVPVAQQVGYKEVGVRPVVRGRVAAGYYLQPIEVEPSTVTVVGSPGALTNVSFVDSEPVDVSNLSSSVVRRVQVVPPTGLTLLQPQPVSLTIRVTPLTVSQTLRVSPTIQGLGPGLEIVGDVPQVDVTLNGPAPTLQTLTPRDFRVAVDLAGLGPGRHEVEPQVAVPGGFTQERVEPARVTVTIRALATPVPSPTPILAPPTPAAEATPVP